VLVKGLYLQGAGWDMKNSCLIEAEPMQLVCPVPTIHFRPVETKRRSQKGIHTHRDRQTDTQTHRNTTPLLCDLDAPPFDIIFGTVGGCHGLCMCTKFGVDSSSRFSLTVRTDTPVCGQGTFQCVRLCDLV